MPGGPLRINDTSKWKVIFYTYCGYIVIRSSLTRLEADNLIGLIQTDPELVYQFQHNLVQEAAYQSMIRQDRRILHRAVGETLQEIFGELPEELTPVLAQHFYLGGDLQQALRYYQLAGEAAAQRFANEEAQINYRHALDIAQSPGVIQSINPQQWTDLYTGLGYSFQRSLQYEHALAAFEQLIDRGTQLNEQRLVLEGTLAQAVIYSTPTPEFNPIKSEALATRAMQLARQLDDQPSQARVLWLLMIQNFFSTNIDAAVRYAQQALEFSRVHGIREQLAFILNDVSSFIYTVIGKIELGLESLLEAGQIFKELNNLPMLADNLVNTGQYYYFLGDPAKALTTLQEGYNISNSTGNLWGEAFSLWGLGYVFLERMEVDAALDALNKAIDISNLAGVTIGRIMGNLMLGVLYYRLGDGNKSRQYANIALNASQGQASLWQSNANCVLALAAILEGDAGISAEYLRKAGFSSSSEENAIYNLLYLSDFPFAYCEYHLFLKNPHAIIEFTDRFLDNPEWRKALGLLPHFLYYRARSHLLLKQTDLAMEMLKEADELCIHLTARSIHWKILATLSEIHHVNGDLNLSKGYRDRASQVIEEILLLTSSPELKQSFLNISAVHAVMND